MKKALTEPPSSVNWFSAEEKSPKADAWVAGSSPVQKVDFDLGGIAVVEWKSWFPPR
jgi:hypothetical protein